jgi:hypothetical protein
MAFQVIGLLNTSKVVDLWRQSLMGWQSDSISNFEELQACEGDSLMEWCEVIILS